MITGAQPLWLEFQLVWWCYISETWEIWVLLTTLPLIIGVYSSYERGDIFSPRSTIYKFTHAYGCSRVASYENQWLSFEALVKYGIEQKFEMDFLFQIMQCCSWEPIYKSIQFCQINSSAQDFAKCFGRLISLKFNEGSAQEDIITYQEWLLICPVWLLSCALKKVSYSSNCECCSGNLNYRGDMGSTSVRQMLTPFIWYFHSYWRLNRESYGYVSAEYLTRVFRW